MLTYLQEQGDALFHRGGPLLVLQGDGGVGVRRWQVALLLDAPVHRLQPLGRGVESEALGYSRGNTCMYFLGMNPIITFLGLHEPL